MIARLFGVVAQLAAQRGDVHVNRAVEHVVVAVPDFLQQLLARLDPAPRAGQDGQQIELDRRERQRLVIQQGHARGGVDPQPAHHDFWFAFGLEPRRRRGWPAA